MSSKTKGSRRGSWISENTIPVRIGALSAILLAALILSTAVIAWELIRNQARITQSNEGFHRLAIAGEADRHFSEMRYWMTDLSVSQLTLSERRADEARERLEESLQQIRGFAPDAAETIGAQSETYYDTALKAADAYTDGNRVLGNTLLAQARAASDTVDETLKSLVDELSARADRTSEEAKDAATAALKRSILACIVICVAGAFLTWRALRSILVPMQGITAAISGLIQGERDVRLPPEGQDEFGRMSQALRALKESQAKRRALENEAREQRNTIMTAIETIPDGFALFDGQDRLLLFNDRFCSIFRHVEDILKPGTSFEDILRQHFQSGAVDTFGLAQEDWIRERIAHHRNPGEGRQEVMMGDAWIQIAKRKTPDGGTVAVYSDISDLKEKQAQLEAANQKAVAANSAKSQFLASMSHELRTPLNAIIGYSEMLSEDAESLGFDSAIEDLEKIMSSGRHLLSLINEVLDLSKIEAGKMEMYVETFPLKPLLEEVASTLAPLIARNNNELVRNFDIGDEEIETDKTKLRQNLFNLLSNAAKFTKNGKIELSVSRSVSDGAGTFRFAVRDEGIGMTPEQQSKLFQAFVQADQTTTRNFGGTGLGLAIAQQFTHMMGGQISVETEEGVGSVFSFEIPARFNDETDAQDQNASDATAVLGRVLIVDDEETPRAAAAKILREQGYEVILASDAESGLRLAREQAPDAVILDVIMPERDGWSMLREMKADPVLCETPVILATIVADREMGLAFGAVEHLIKPVDPAKLVTTLETIANGKEKDVLIVDDDAATRNLFRRILIREGWHVREASDGSRALSLLKAHKPTLMVLDIMMPKLDGFDVLRSLRDSEELADLPVIVATSKDLTRAELDWLKQNAGEVVLKGENGRSDLIAALSRHLDNQRELKRKRDVSDTHR